MLTSILFFGIRRSGNHAIQDWIAKTYYNPCVLWNDLKFPLRKPYTEYKSKMRLIGGGGDVQGGVVQIASFEDYTPQDVPDESFSKYVAVLRDPYNCFASRLCASTEVILQDRLKNFRTSLENWKQYHRLSSKWIVIDYNQWVSDPEYRKSIPLWGREDIDVRSHRSSFKDEDYLNRWQAMEEACKRDVRIREAWNIVLQDQEVTNLSLHRWGWALNDEGHKI